MEILTDPLITVGNLYNTLSEICDEIDQKFSKGIEDFKNKTNNPSGYCRQVDTVNYQVNIKLL